MLRKLYNWMMDKAKGPTALPALAAVSFIESSVFPLPPDLMLIPMCLADRRRAFLFALVCTLASVVGALLGYAIGFFAYETIGTWIINLYGGADKMYGEFQSAFAAHGFWLVVMAGFTPFPFKVITICSGLAKLDILTLVVASLVSRGARFFLEAGLIYLYGERIRGLIEKYFELLATAFFVLLIGGFLLVKYIL